MEDCRYGIQGPSPESRVAIRGYVYGCLSQSLGAPLPKHINTTHSARLAHFTIISVCGPAWHSRPACSHSRALAVLCCLVGSTRPGRLSGG